MEPAVSFDRIAAEYEATRALPADLHRFAVEMIRDEASGHALLDVGVGTGRFALALQAAGVRLTGCDVAPAMLREGWRRGVRQVCRADARRMPFRDRAFGRAMSNHVLHLVRDWPIVLGEVARVTNGRYLSLVEHETSVPDLSEEYHQELAGESPHLSDHPGIHEEDLVDRLAPDRRRSGELVRRDLAADALLEILDRRVYSSQWDVADDAHARAMATLRRRYGGTTVRNELRVELVVWETSRLAEFARAHRRAVPHAGGGAHGAGVGWLAR